MQCDVLASLLVCWIITFASSFFFMKYKSFVNQLLQPIKTWLNIVLDHSIFCFCFVSGLVQLRGKRPSGGCSSNLYYIIEVALCKFVVQICILLSKSSCIRKLFFGFVVYMNYFLFKYIRVLLGFTLTLIIFFYERREILLS